MQKEKKQVLVEAFWVYQNYKSFGTPEADQTFKPNLFFLQSQTKTSAKTCIANWKQKYPKDCFLVHNLHTTRKEKNEKKCLVSCKEQHYGNAQNTWTKHTNLECC